MAGGWAGRLKPADVFQAKAAMLPHDRGHREPEIAGSAQRAPALAPVAFNLAAVHATQPRGRAVRAARAIPKAVQAARDVAREPLPHRLPGDLEFAGQFRLIPMGAAHPLDEFDSPRIAQACILVGVHRSSGSCRLSVPTTPAWCRYDL